MLVVQLHFHHKGLVAQAVVVLVLLVEIVVQVAHKVVLVVMV
jgi:hypothetical protein